jgi:4-diphosphocytidyl-2-methyl-D-erithritol synthase
MNIGVILSSGTGQRFGSDIPKQYHLINGKTVISYVVDALKGAKRIDKILIVANKFYEGSLVKDFDAEFAEGGEKRNISLSNGLNYIKQHYPDTQNIIILDAVRPLVYPELIDKYLELLEKYDCVITAQTITDSLGSYDFQRVDRSRFYLMQSPEAFKFNLLYNNFSKDSEYTEVSQQLPENSKKYLYKDFVNNIKITYKHDLEYAALMIKKDISGMKFNIKRLCAYLYKNYPADMDKWLKKLDFIVDELFEKWKIISYRLNENSHFGVVLFAESKIYGDVVVKIIPPFIERFEREMNSYKFISDNVLCKLYDIDIKNCALLIKLASPGTYMDFNNNGKVYIKKLFDTAVFEKKIYGGNIFPRYFDKLTEKLNQLDWVSYKKEIIVKYVTDANEKYKDIFADDINFLIHGDLHKYNILLDGDKLIAVDPIGFLAPIEFEFARYIGTILTEQKQDVNIPIAFHEALTFFSNYSSEEKIKSALFIDIVFRMHNSLTENEDFTLTDKWLNILKLIN